MENTYVDSSYDTSTITIGSKHYCVYCGQEVLPDVVIEDHCDSYTYYHCSCECAQIEHKLKSEIEQKKREIKTLESRLPKPKYGMVTKFQKL